MNKKKIEHLLARSTPTQECIVCGGRDIQPLYEVTDTNDGIPGIWEITACQNCGLGILAPFPTPEQVAGFYRNQFYNNKGERFRGWVETLRYGLAILRVRTLNSLAPGRGKLLDFGSGAGHFAKAQTSVGWQVIAMDPYSAAATDQSELRVDGPNAKLPYPDSTFDAVTLWYVIEHVSNPRHLMTEFHRVLKPGGILVLAQQDFGSLQARFFGPRWLLLDPPRHLWQFDQANLSELSRQIGFSAVAVDRSSIEMGPFTILQSSLNALVGNGNYLFKFLKSAKLPEKGEADVGATWRLAVSLVLVPLLIPVSIIAYFALLLIKSGDAFTLYCRKQR